MVAAGYLLQTSATIHSPPACCWRRDGKESSTHDRWAVDGRSRLIGKHTRDVIVDGEALRRRVPTRRSCGQESGTSEDGAAVRRFPKRYADLGSACRPASSSSMGVADSSRPRRKNTSGSPASRSSAPILIASEP